VVIASGGLSIPKIRTDFGYRVARQFGCLVEPRPAAPPTFDKTAWSPYAQLAALPVRIETGSKSPKRRF
jgi:predicted flavoprotein YhiN